MPGLLAGDQPLATKTFGPQRIVPRFQTCSNVFGGKFLTRTIIYDKIWFLDVSREIGPSLIREGGLGP